MSFLREFRNRICKKSQMVTRFDCVPSSGFDARVRGSPGENHLFNSSRLQSLVEICFHGCREHDERIAALETVTDIMKRC